MCEPFGRSDPESVINYGRDDIHEHDYIFFFDQEPIHLDIHWPTFAAVDHQTYDIRWHPPGVGKLVTSEKNSEDVEQLCAQLGWKNYYYFFHGWAALDWYRGYNRTFLIKPWQQRQIVKTFVAPNRIVAGRRQHRLQILYHIFKNRMTDNHISCPKICPAENIAVSDAVKGLTLRYPDIETVFAAQTLPINFANETDHPMHSCWLSLFGQCAESLLYLVTETVATGRRLHITEKTFKPIAMGMPFVIVGTKGSLQYMRDYGFRTFEGIWDESYDLAEDNVRIDRIASLLRSLDELSPAGKQHLFEQCWPVIEHNWHHFYGGGFESILWQEMQEMLHAIKIDCGQNDQG